MFKGRVSDGECVKTVGRESYRSRMVGVSAGMSVLSFSDVYVTVVVTGFVAVMYGAVSAGVVAAFAGVPWLFLSGYGGRVADRLTRRGWRRWGMLGTVAGVAVVGGAVMVMGEVLAGDTAGSVSLVTVLWGVVLLALGCLETVRNSVARVMLMDMDESGESKRWFARVDRASYMVGLSFGGVAAALFGWMMPVWLGGFLVVTALMSAGVLLKVMPGERTVEERSLMGEGVGRRRGLGLVPPLPLSRELAEALLVLAVVGLFCIQNVALWPMTAAVFPMEGLLGWMRAVAAVGGVIVLVLSFSTVRKVVWAVRFSAVGMVGVCGVFAVGVVCGVQYGWWWVGVVCVLVGAFLAGGFVGLLLTGSRQLGAVLAPKDKVGEVTGWTSLPANGFAVVTGPLVGVAVMMWGVGWVWGVLAVGAALMLGAVYVVRWCSGQRKNRERM